MFKTKHEPTTTDYPSSTRLQQQQQQQQAQTLLQSLPVLQQQQN